MVRSTSPLSIRSRVRYQSRRLRALVFKLTRVPLVRGRLEESSSADVFNLHLLGDYQQRLSEMMSSYNADVTRLSNRASVENTIEPVSCETISQEPAFRDLPAQRSTQQSSANADSTPALEHHVLDYLPQVVQYFLFS